MIEVLSEEVIQAWLDRVEAPVRLMPRRQILQNKLAFCYFRKISVLAEAVAPKTDTPATGTPGRPEPGKTPPLLQDLLDAGFNEKYDGNQMAGSYSRLSGSRVRHHPRPLPLSRTKNQGPG